MVGASLLVLAVVLTVASLLVQVRTNPGVPLRFWGRMPVRSRTASVLVLVSIMLAILGANRLDDDAGFDRWMAVALLVVAVYLPRLALVAWQRTRRARTR